MTFIANIKEKGISLGSDYNKARFLDFCKKNQGKKIRIELIKTTRTDEQNRLYWLYLDVISKETGNDTESLHLWFKQLLPRRIKKILINKKEREVEYERTTTNLTKDEFSDYLEKISALVNISIPNTEEYNKWFRLAPLINETL